MDTGLEKARSRFLQQGQGGAKTGQVQTAQTNRQGGLHSARAANGLASAREQFLQNGFGPSLSHNRNQRDQMLAEYRREVPTIDPEDSIVRAKEAKGFSAYDAVRFGANMAQEAARSIEGGKTTSPTKAFRAQLAPADAQIAAMTYSMPTLAPTQLESTLMDLADETPLEKDLRILKDKTLQRENRKKERDQPSETVEEWEGRQAIYQQALQDEQQQAQRMEEDRTALSQKALETGEFSDFATAAQTYLITAQTISGSLSKQDLDQIDQLQKALQTKIKTGTKEEAATAQKYFQMLDKAYRGGKGANIADTALYTMGQVALGAESTVNSIGAGLEVGATNMGTKGQTANELPILDQWLAENPIGRKMLQDYELSRKGRRDIANWISAQTGVSVASVDAYLAATKNQRQQQAFAESFGSGVSQEYQNTAGKWAYTIGQQLPGIAFSAGSAAAEAGGLLGNLLSGEGLKKAAASALKGNLGTYLIGASSAGNKLSQNILEGNGSAASYVNALGTGFMEYFTEGLFGFSDMPSYKALFEGVSADVSQSIAKGIFNYLASGVEEGLEEVINVPLEGIVDKLTTQRDKPLTGSGGIFDWGQMMQGGMDGAIVGMLMGGVSAAAGIYTTAQQSRDLSSGLREMQQLAQKLPEDLRPMVGPAQQVTQEILDDYTAQVLKGWEVYSQRLQQEQAAGVNTGIVFPSGTDTENAASTTETAGSVQPYQKQERHGTILDTMRKTLPSLEGMEPVKRLTGSEFQRSKTDTRPLRQKVVEFFNSIGNKVTRKDLGEIELNTAGARDSLAHGYGKLKAATFAALPEVLEQGQLIAHNGPYAGHGYDSYIISAPVQVGDETVYVGALVIKDRTQRYKLHEVLTTNESGASLFQSETTSQGAGGPLRSDTPLGKPEGSLTNSMLQGDENVNTEADLVPAVGQTANQQTAGTPQHTQQSPGGPQMPVYSPGQENIRQNQNGPQNAANDAIKTLGENGQKMYQSVRETEVGRQYDDETLFGGFAQAYQAGLTGQSLSDVKGGYAAKLTEGLRQVAYAAGQQDAAIAQTEKNNYTTTKNRKGTDKNATEKVYLRDGGQRAGGTDSGGQVSPVEKGAGQDSSRTVQGRPADGGAASLTYGEKVSPSSLGIGGGSTKTSIRLVTGGETEFTKVAKALAQKRGLRLTLFVGDNLQIRQKDGSWASARGYISGDRVFIRADHPRYTTDQLMRHEAGHDMIAKGEVDIDAVRKRIAEHYDSEMAAQLYMEAYNGTGMGPEEIWKEIICDSLGDMNIFSDTAVQELSQELLTKTKEAAENTRSKGGDTRGPPLETGSQMSRELGPIESGFTQDKYFARQMDRWTELADGSRVKVGMVREGSAINRVGLPASGMYFDVGKIKTALKAHGDHLTPEILKGIPDLLNDPIVITEYRGPNGTIKNTVNVYGNLFYNGTPVVVGAVMHLDRTGRNIISNIRTIHVRSDFAKQITDGSVLYLNENKKMTRKWFQVCGNLNVPLEGTQFGVIRSIAFDSEKVNGSFSQELESVERLRELDTNRLTDYDSMIDRPDMHLTEIDDSVAYTADSKTRKAIVQKAIENATEIGSTNASGGVSVYVEDIGRDVVLSGNALKHGLDRRLQQNAAVTLQAGELLQNAILINELTPKQENAAESYVLLSAARGNKGIYIVEFVVNQYDNVIMSMDLLYSLNAKKEPAVLNAPSPTGNPLTVTGSSAKPAALLPAITENSATLTGPTMEPAVLNAPGLTGNPLLVTGSTISIAQLLDLASRNFPDILPESVLRHYGYDSRPDGRLGESALYSQELESVERLREETKRLEQQARREGWSNERLIQERRNAVDRVYEGLLERFGAMEAGESPYRQVQVPKRTSRAEAVSQTVRTILEARATPEEAIPDIQELVAKGTFSYEAVTDQAAIEKATRTITEKNWAKAYHDWKSAMKAGQVSKDLTALGWALYNNAANSGNLEVAMDVLQDMVAHQRNAAQALQATRILKSLSPEGQLYGVVQSVEGLQKELNERYGDKKSPKLKINEELGKKLLEAKDQAARDRVLQDIYRDIGRQMPSRFMDKWNAWRYLSMLGNPRTHVRNILGNAGFAPVVAVKNMTATAIEKAVGAVSGGRLARSKAFVGLGAKGRGLLAAAWADYANVEEAALGSGKYTDFQNANKYIEEGRVIFQPGKITKHIPGAKLAGKALETARKANSRALDVEDVWFSKPHYAYAMAQFCAAHKITEAEIRRGNAQVLAAARNYAIREAQKATYRDTNALSQTMSGLGRDMMRSKNLVSKGLGIVTEGILPFRKTPANILARGLEYSPLGLVKSLSYDLYQVGKGKLTGAQCIDNVSAGLTGTGLLALGVYLAAQGLIRGTGSGDDKEKELARLQGHQDYALELPGGRSITLDWLAPEALPLFVGVNLWEQAQTMGDTVTFSQVLDAVGNVAEPMLEMSCLQSLNDALDVGRQVNSEGLGVLPSVLVGAATSYLTQGLPTFLGQLERTLETERKTTYTEKNGFLTSDMQYTLGKISGKIPLWEYQQIPYIDAWGRHESSGTVSQRAVNNFLNPAYTSQIEESPVEKELLRLYQATGEGSVLPSRMGKSISLAGTTLYLSSDEYVLYATEAGQQAQKELISLTQSEAYREMSDEEKVKAVGDVFENARKQAAVLTVEKMVLRNDVSWGEKAEAAHEACGIDPADYMLAQARASTAHSLKDANGKTIDNSEGLMKMLEVYSVKGLTDAQRQYLFTDLGVGKTVIGYNRAAVEEALRKMKQAG